jgi:hypothetical protein
MKRANSITHRGFYHWQDTTSLPQLQVLILDKTKVNDDGLRAIAQVAPALRYLSLQVGVHLLVQLDYTVLNKGELLIS